MKLEFAIFVRAGRAREFLERDVSSVLDLFVPELPNEEKLGKIPYNSLHVSSAINAWGFHDCKSDCCVSVRRCLQLPGPIA